MISHEAMFSIQEARFQCHHLAKGNALQARDLGSYLVIKRVGTLYWTIKNCDSIHLTHVCEVNMVKPYFERGIT